MKRGKRPSIHDLAGLADDAEFKSADRLSWDFSSCPDSEVDECHAYEFARSVRPILQDVARLRRRKKQTFDDLFRALKEVVFAPTSRRLYALFWFHPEFPEKPYLSISVDERRRRTKVAWPSDPQSAHAAMLCPKILPQFLGKDLRAGILKVGRPSVFYGSFELALIEIQWMYSNERLLKTFAAWLSENRPANVKVFEEKGAGNYVRRLRDDLKSLGAWRLLNFQGMTWEEAFLITSEEGKFKGLYSNHPAAWEVAKKRARSILRDLITHYGRQHTV